MDRFRELARNPRLMMEYQATGKLPSPRLQRAERTPLLNLLASLSPSLRGAIIGVKLSPALGYDVGCTFSTAEHLYRYIGGYRNGNRPEIGEYRMIRSFKGEVTLDMLLNASACPPSDSVIRFFGFDRHACSASH